LGYLICDKCKGYYELQHGESPENFSDICKCGGKLKYTENLDILEPKTQKTTHKEKKKTKKKSNKSNTSYYRDLSYINKFIKKINFNFNPFAISIGLIFSIIVLILASFIFGVLMITGIFGIIIYAILTLVFMTLIGGLVTGFVGCHNLEEGGINGGFLTLILLIIIGVLLGIVWFIVVGYLASVISSLGSIAHSAGTSTAATSGSSGDSLGSIFNTILNIFYAIIAVVLSFAAGIGGGSLGVIIKKRLKIPL
jgi:hypothetical protein